MALFDLITPISYWVLTILWLIILGLYIGKLNKSKAAGGAVAALLTILAIDAFRTLFESAYFGLYFNSLFGLIPKSVYNLLSEPSLIIIPKIINIVAGLAVLFILIRRWVPTELKEREEWIDELKQSKTNAEKNEARLAAIFDGITDAIVFTDTERRIVSANKGLTTTFGYSLDDVIGKRTSFLYESLDEYERQGRIRFNLSAEEKVKPYVVSYKRKDGKVFTGETLGTVIRGSSGNTIGYIGVMRDVSERKEAEDALLTSEERYRNLIENSPLCIHEVDMTGNIISMNQTGLEMMGADKESDVFGLKYIDVPIAEDQKRISKFLEAAKSGESSKFEFSVEGQNGPLHFSSSFNPIRDQNGTVIKVMGVTQDVTERRKSEVEIARSRELLEATTDSLNLAITVFDEDLILVVRNSHFGEFLELPDELTKVGVSYEAIIRFNATRGDYGPGNIEELVQERVRLAQDPKLHTLERVLPSGRILEIVGNPMPKGGFVTTYSDVTEKRTFEKQVQYSQKMDAIGQLTGGIAHDFNNILGIAIGNIELAERESSKNKDVSERMAKGKKALLRASSLTQKLLSFSKAAPHKEEALNVNEYIVETTSLLEHSIPSGAELNTILADDLWLAKVDGEEFNDAIVNMCVNAGHAMSGGSLLTIETSNLEQVKNFDGNVHDYVLITISDTGEGIPKDVIDHIFEPFFSTKEKDKGTGLGLSMVYGFIKRSGGDIKVVSEVGVGTTFQIMLPRFKGTQTSEDIIVERRQHPSEVHGETILVVDDEDDLAELASEFLKNAGYKTLVATSGEQALKILNLNRNVALIFSDIIMPGGMNGFELAITVMKHYPTVKISLASGFAAQAGHKLIEGNIFAKQLSHRVLKKPYSNEGLISHIGRELRTKDVVQWNSELETGISFIDDDHKVLVSLINKASVIGSREDTSDICTIVKDLDEYINFHFDREEIIMEAVGFPHLAAHKKMHKQLRKEVSKCCFTCDHNSENCDVGNIIAFLEKWLIDHIMGSDMKIAKYSEGKEEIIGAALEAHENAGENI